MSKEDIATIDKSVSARHRKNELNKIWYWHNRDAILQRRKENGFVKKQKAWLQMHPGYYVEYQKQWRIRNREKLLQQGKQYYTDNYDKIKAYRASHNKALRLKILEIVGKGEIRCANCSCDDMRLLEINHINGGGKQEIMHNNFRYYYNILNGVRKTDDLEIRCRVCNALHYLEMKFGKLPYTLTYKKE